MKHLEQPFPEENLSITFRNETEFPKSVRKDPGPIPIDLLIDILSRLPRKSIDRFRCVSKFWGYILRRPDFTELFLTNSSTRPRILFIVEADGKLLFYSSPQPQTQTQDDNSTLVATRYHTSFPKYLPSDEFSTVCGLALLHNYYKKQGRVFCNPITGEFLTLPEVKVNLDTEAKEEMARIGLGNDPISKQFKLLCMTSSPCDRPTTYQVLTLEPEKRLWRRVECGFHFTGIRRMSDEICINSVLYFRAWLGQSSVVVCFDVGSEKFDFIKIDEEDIVGEVGYYFSGGMVLFNYKGKLCIRQETDYWKIEDEIVLWVVEDAGNHKWSKHTYELPTLISSKQFVGMTVTGETVWSSYKNDPKPFFLDFYNLERKTCTRVDIQGFEEFKRRTIHILLDYVENLRFI
ncbi:unnamed protein product [Microthlaspi erraticum]|uniref:F-box domain-containing protein n=1 Tax=Microthlaspi erraticum TaxID=1685480 RepID=A0A6D2IRG0_9BRAS|nr:unnamed protein product [Microthlaspi erraticum]